MVRGGLIAVGAVALAVWDLGGLVNGLSSEVGLFLLFLFEWGYFAFCEGISHGRTIGKAAHGLRVIQRDGTPLTFWSAISRNLVRGADAVPIYGPAAICMTLSGNFERLGDLVAGTIVVRERIVRLPREPVIMDRINPLDREQLGSYRPDRQLLAAIEEFLSRRAVLDHRRGHQLAGPLAEALAQELQYSGDRQQLEEFPMAFLARVLVTFQARDTPFDDSLVLPHNEPMKPDRRRSDGMKNRG